MSKQNRDKKGRGKEHKPAEAEQVEAGNSAGGDQAFIEKFYGDQSKWFIAFVLFVGCVMIYYQTINFDFINFDDNLYVYKNKFTMDGLSWAGFKWAFTTFHATNWHPLTWLSLQLDVSLFGVQSGYIHLVNVFYHAVNSVLLFFTIRLLTGSTWRSAVVAAIFAFHPGHVESVAWVSERKDLLSTLFCLLTICAYTKYARGAKSPGRYVLVIVLFILGLMSKPMLVTLPFLLLLLDYWPLKRIDNFDWRTLKPLLIEKLPLFALIAASSVTTYVAQKAGGAVMPLEALAVSMRLQNALVSYAKYIGTLFYPWNLAGWYPYPESFPWWQPAGAALLIGGVSAYAIIAIRRQRYFFVGWFWYLGTLVPVIGLIQVGAQSYADRYTYIPFIGLSIALVWLVSELLEKLKVNKDAISAGVIALMLALAIISFRQAAFWKDTEIFYQHALAVTERTYIFEQNYCDYLLKNNRIDEAEVQCRNSIKSNPNHANAYITLGVIEMQKGNSEAGLHDFEMAARLQPDDIQAYGNYVNALISVKKYDEAAAAVVKIENWDTSGGIVTKEVVEDRLYPIYRLLGFAYGRDENIEKGIEYLQKALALDNTEPDVHSNLGMLLYQHGKQDEAYAELTYSLKLYPEQPDIHNAVGKILLFQNKRDEAIGHFKEALRIDPNSKNAARNLKDAQSGKKTSK